MRDSSISKAIRKFFPACLMMASLSAAATNVTADQGAPPAVGDEAPDFTLENTSGKKFQLSALVKKGPVVLVVLRGFPGYQCPLCTAQAGQFLSRDSNFREARASVVFIYPGPAMGLKQHANEFVTGKQLPENFYLLLDPDYAFTKDYRLRWEAPRETAYPSTFVIDGDRKIRFAKISKTHGDRAKVEDVLKALPAKQASFR